MKNIFLSLRKNALIVFISLLFYIAFVYLAFSGNRIFSNDITESYHPGQSVSHGAVIHYYHK